MKTEILSDRPILHRADTQGPRITREQVIGIDGAPFRISFWSDAAGRLLRVDCAAVARGE